MGGHNRLQPGGKILGDIVDVIAARAIRRITGFVTSSLTSQRFQILRLVSAKESYVSC